tara:strand:+ start:476 stop:772 length:297 start_codon:yes stop_codon:yes gene_type:complete
MRSLVSISFNNYQSSSLGENNYYLYLMNSSLEYTIKQNQEQIKHMIEKLIKKYEEQYDIYLYLIKKIDKDNIEKSIQIAQIRALKQLQINNTKFLQTL